MSDEKKLGQVMYEAVKAHFPGWDDWATLPCSARLAYEAGARAVVKELSDRCGLNLVMSPNGSIRKMADSAPDRNGATSSEASPVPSTCIDCSGPLLSEESQARGTCYLCNEKG